MPGELQPTLLKLAVLPSITPDAIQRFADDDIVRRALALGFLTRAGPEIESFHPLLRNFLIRRFSDLASDQLSTTIDAVGSYLISRKSWDDVLILLAQFPSALAVITRLLEEG